MDRAHRPGWKWIAIATLSAVVIGTTLAVAERNGWPSHPAFVEYASFKEAQAKVPFAIHVPGAIAPEFKLLGIHVITDNSGSILYAAWEDGAANRSFRLEQTDQTIEPGDPSVEIQVKGRPAKLSTGTNSQGTTIRALYWSTGKTTFVLTAFGLTEEAVLQIAEGLQPLN